MTRVDLARLSDVASGVPSGTSFPGTPASNDLFYRTDRDLLYFYDGTRWLTVNLYTYAIPSTTAALSATASFGFGGIPVLGLYDIWIEDVRMAIQYGGGTISGTAYWNLSLSRLSNTASRTTVATTGNLTTDTVSQINLKTIVVDAVLTSSQYGFDVLATKTSTPPDINRAAVNFDYRIVG